MGAVTPGCQHQGINDRRDKAMTATTRTLQAIRNGVLTIGVCASLVIGSLGFAGSAEARIPQDGDLMSDFARHCKYVQDAYDRYMADKNYVMADAFADHWYKYGCGQWYGFIEDLHSSSSTHTVQPSSATQGTAPAGSPTKVQRATSPISIAR
jgi:hypothetical protein